MIKYLPVERCYFKCHDFVKMLSHYFQFVNLILKDRVSSIFIALVLASQRVFEIIKKNAHSAISSVILIFAAEHHEYVANVLYEMGMSQLRSGNVKHAFQNFSKFLAMTKRISDPEGICNAHMAMAFAYKLRNTYTFSDDTQNNVWECQIEGK